MDEDKVVCYNPENGNAITQGDVDRWCNCFNFPHQKCDECQYILSGLDEKKELGN